MATTGRQDQVTRQTMGTLVLQSMPGVMPFQVVRLIAQWLFSIFSVSIEVLFRRNFGERYLTNVAGITTFAAIVAGILTLGRGSALGWVFLLVYSAAVLFHGLQILRRNWVTFIPWHSYASGDSWLSVFTSPLRQRVAFNIPIPDVTQRVVEPLIACVIGLFTPDPFLRPWLIAAGLALAFREGLKHREIRNTYLDMVDQDIEASTRRDLFVEGWASLTEVAGDQRPPTSLREHGFTAFVPIPVATPQQREDAVKTLSRLYPREMEEARGQVGGLQDEYERFKASRNRRGTDDTIQDDAS